MKKEEIEERLKKVVQEMQQTRAESQRLFNEANKLEGQAALLQELLLSIKPDKEEAKKRK
jgi:cell division protein FtsB